MIKRVAVLLALALACALTLAAPALAQGGGTGTISGTLVNGTSGVDGVVAGQDVTLMGIANGQITGSSSVKSDAQGKFVFNNLSTDVAYSYQVLATYQGVHYTSDPIAFASGETSKAADIKVYETTDSDAAVTVMLGHVVFTQNQGVLSIKEYSLVVNSGDRTYTGSAAAGPAGQKQTLSLSLPKGATNVQFTNGLSDLTASLGGDGIVSTMPVIPGMNEVGYTYELKNSSNKYTFTKKIEQTTARIDVVAKGDKVGIAGQGLTAEEPLFIQGAMYSHAYRESLNAGDTLTAQLSGLTGSESQSMVLWVGVALAVLVVVGGAGYIWTRRRPQPAPAGPSVGLDEGQRLLAELARLDDDFESKKISEQDYRTARAAKKAQLVEHLQNSEKKSDKQ